VIVLLHQPWLSPASEEDLEAQRRKACELHRGLHEGVVRHGPSGAVERETDPRRVAREEPTSTHGQHHHHHHHHHDEDPPHTHEARAEVELKASEIEVNDNTAPDT